MSAIENVGDNLSDTFTDYGDRFLDFFPKLVVALLLFTVGSIIASVVARTIHNVLSKVEQNDSVQALLGKTQLGVSISSLVATFIKWIILFVFLSAAVEAIEVQALSDILQRLIEFMPNIFAAGVIAALTFVAAHIVRDLVDSTTNAAKVPHGRLIGTAAVVAVWAIGIPFALAQLELDVTLINNNINIIVAGVVGAGALAFGLGARSVAGSLVAGQGTRELVSEGQKIVVGETAGKVTKVGRFGVVVKTAKGDMIVPHSRLMAESADD